MQEIRAKVVLIGSIGVGKTSVVERFVHRKFSNNYLSTIGVRVDSAEVKLADAKVKLLIWDLAGELYLSEQYNQYLNGSAGAILIYDITRPDTYDEIQSVAKAISKEHPALSLLILANKSDLRDDPQYRDGISDDHKFDYMTSAKTGEKVEMAFQKIAQNILENTSHVKTIER